MKLTSDTAIWLNIMRHFAKKEDKWEFDGAIEYFEKFYGGNHA
jgi:hypothetical protein